jgi:hypothetical protein
MRLTVLVIRRKTFIGFFYLLVEKINHPWQLMDPIRETESLLWARPAIVLNDVLQVFIWREGFRLAQTPVTRSGARLY